MIKLYGRGQSRSFRALWALNESGLPFEYIEMSADNAPQNYSHMNSQGKIPTLVDGELVLTESAAIVNHVARQSGRLMPSDIQELAQYDNLAYFVMTDFEQPLWTMGKHRFALPEQQRVEAIFPTTLFEYKKSEEALLVLLGNRNYAVGSVFTMADILIAHTINWAERFTMPVTKELIAFRDFHYARPACVASLKTIGA